MKYKENSKTNCPNCGYKKPFRYLGLCPECDYNDEAQQILDIVTYDDKEQAELNLGKIARNGCV